MSIFYVSYRCTHAPAAGFVQLGRRNPQQKIKDNVRSCCYDELSLVGRSEMTGPWTQRTHLAVYHLAEVEPNSVCLSLYYMDQDLIQCAYQHSYASAQVAQRGGDCDPTSHHYNPLTADIIHKFFGCFFFTRAHVLHRSIAQDRTPGTLVQTVACTTNIV